jgi:poly-gamma-glutamate capsule biosynthesis protein CapA/YwtB (metallophosphatase superfamily)
MKKFLAYLAGGLACLGAGAGFYIALATMPSSRPALPMGARSAITDSIEALLPLVGDRLGNSGSTSQGDATGFLGEVALRQAQGDNEQPRNDTILFMGDIMLGRNVAAKMAKNGNDYPFAKIKDVVASADYAIANLEGPMTKINNAPSNNMRFHFDPALGLELSAAGFDAFSLANNHGLDQGTKGESDTHKSLEATRLKYFGDVSSDDGPILNFSIGDEKFAVIGLHDVYRKIDPKAVAEKIAATKKDGDIVIVYPHWGDEYQHEHNAQQERLAHAFIDAGADLVIGSHPHVIQDIESYKGKFIFYSLGNLVFDQYFSKDTQEGVALRLNVGKTGIDSIELLSYEIPQSQPAMVDGEKKTKVLQNIASWSDPALKDMIETGVLEIKS